MKQILRPDGYQRVADGTEVGPLLNASKGPALNADISLATGHIAAGVCSAVHFHPVVTQLTYILAGTLKVWMRDPGADAPYCLAPQQGDSVVTEPGTLLQLHNDSKLPVTVLYVVTPGYLQHIHTTGAVDFEDAVIAGPSWDALAITQLDTNAARTFAQRRAEVKLRRPN